VARRIVIIGGAACGLKAASRARRLDGEVEITVIEQGRYVSYAACGMPYVVSGRIKKAADLIQRTPAYFERIKGIRLLTGCRATAIDRERKMVRYRPPAGGQPELELPYGKLVLATGARPAAPPLAGLELPGVFRLKELGDVEAISQAIPKARRAVVIGAGPIGIEMAEAFRARGLEVALIEAKGHVLPGLLDFEMARLLERHLEARGVEVRCGARLLGFEGNGRLERVVAGSQERLEAEVALLATGALPNVELARAAGLALGETGAILVDEHLRTSDADIFAGGDCVESRHLITGRPVYIPLGTTANKHGRLIGDNLCGGNEAFPGVLGTSLLKAFDYTVGRSGLTSREAAELGLETCEALVPAPDRAPYYGGARHFALKLLAERPGGRILGVQLVGPGEVARRLDAAVAAMSCGVSAAQMAQLDFGYSPPYALAMDLLITAANVLRNKLEGLVSSASPEEVKAALASAEPPLLLDVRSKPEWAKVRLNAGDVVHLPFPQLRKKLGRLPKDRDIVTFCWGGLRAYEAALMLRRAGFERVRFMDGSLFTWPFELAEDEADWR
jgi:NADPH-dependent 2,4-dienoyl-CoA reductase/sulfur reductase-like enzyme/rhodanese-related sulfurtransferase